MSLKPGHVVRRRGCRFGNRGNPSTRGAAEIHEILHAQGHDGGPLTFLARRRDQSIWSSPLHTIGRRQRFHTVCDISWVWTRANAMALHICLGLHMSATHQAAPTRGFSRREQIVAERSLAAARAGHCQAGFESCRGPTPLGGSVFNGLDLRAAIPVRCGRGLSHDEPQALV